MQLASLGDASRNVCTHAVHAAYWQCEHDTARRLWPVYAQQHTGHSAVSIAVAAAVAAAAAAAVAAAAEAMFVCFHTSSTRPLRYLSRATHTSPSGWNTT